MARRALVIVAALLAGSFALRAAGATADKPRTGVFPRRRLVFASDKNSGLRIVRARGLPPPRGR